MHNDRSAVFINVLSSDTSTHQGILDVAQPPTRVKLWKPFIACRINIKTGWKISHNISNILTQKSTLTQIHHNMYSQQYYFSSSLRSKYRIKLKHQPEVYFTWWKYQSLILRDISLILRDFKHRPVRCRIYNYVKKNYSLGLHNPQGHQMFLYNINDFWNYFQKLHLSIVSRWYSIKFLDRDHANQMINITGIHFKMIWGFTLHALLLINQTAYYVFKFTRTPPDAIV